MTSITLFGPKGKAILQEIDAGEGVPLKAACVWPDSGRWWQMRGHGAVMLQKFCKFDPA
jgi:hypothetical protein